MFSKVKLRIKSTVTDLILADRYLNSSHDGMFTADDGKSYTFDKINELSSEIIEYTCFGECSEDDGKFTISYKENPEIGYDNCITSLVFSNSNRKSLILIREGDISTALNFDMNDKRQCCRYETPIMPFEFVINTRSVHNTVNNDGGAILLDYNIEVRGANTERNKLFIEVKRYDDGE